MAGMGGRTGGDGPIQSTGHHDVGRGTADAFGRTISKGVDAAWPLKTVATAQTGIAEAALGRHGGITIPDRCRVDSVSLSDHLPNGRIQTFVHCLFVLCHNRLPPHLIMEVEKPADVGKSYIDCGGKIRW
jgi:hypothetical protein